MTTTWITRQDIRTRPEYATLDAERERVPAPRLGDGVHWLD